MIRLLIIDDHEMVREGLKAILTTEPDFEIVGDAASAELLGVHREVGDRKRRYEEFSGFVDRSSQRYNRNGRCSSQCDITAKD